MVKPKTAQNTTKEQGKTSSKLSKLELPFRTTLLYLFFGALWILLSDQILSHFVFYNTKQVTYQTLKGWFFVIVSGSLLYLLLRGDLARRKRVEAETVWLASFPEQDTNPVVEIDATGIVFYMNPSAQEKFPNLREQGFKHPWLAGLEEIISRFEQEGIHHLQRDMEINDEWYSQSLYYLSEVARLRIYAADITELKQAEKETRSRSRQLAALLEASQSLTESLNLGEVLQKITDKAADVLGVEKTAIYLAEQEQLYLAASTPALPPEFPETLRKALLVDHPHIAEALAAGQSILLPDTAFASLTPAEQAVSDSLGLRTILFVPLAAKKDALGVLILGAVGKPREFSQSDQDLVHALSNQAALAITNAKLYEDRVRHVQELENQIAERKQAEAQKQKLMQEWDDYYRRIQLILEHMPIGCIMNDIDFNVIYWNRAAESIFGYSAEDIRGKQPYGMFIPEEARPYVEDIRQKMVNQHVPIFGKNKNITKDGRVISCEWHDVPLLDAQGNFAGFLGLVQDVTERERSEAALYESEERLRLSLQAANQGLYDLNVQTGNTIVNRQYAEMLGYDPETFVETNAAWIERLHPDDRESVAKTYDDYIKGLLPEYRVEFRQRMKNGRWKWILSLGKVIGYDAEGKPLRMLGTHTDINERKQAENALKESEERFRLLFENNHATMMLIEPVSGAIVNANKAAAEFYGYTLPELCALNLSDINPLPPEELQAERIRALQQERSFFNFQHRLANGELRSVEIHSAPMEVDGRILLFSIIYDVTESKRAEGQIQRQLKYMNALRMIDIAISSSFDLHVILDVILQQVLSQLKVDASAVLLVNPQLQTIEYAASRGFYSNALQHTQLKLGEGYAGSVVLERKTVHISALMETRGKLAKALQLAKERFVDYYGVPLMVKGEVKGVLEIYQRSFLKVDHEWLEFLEALAGQAAIAIDNAQLFENLQRLNAGLEQRIVERTAELQHANAELEHANRVKDEFLANMSHELRTPLTSILGLSESLLEQRRAPLTEHQRRSLEIVAASGQHLLELINDILDLSKIEAGKFDYYPQPVSVDDICRSSLSFVKSQAAKKSIHVTYIEEPSISKIFADPRRLKQILVNLLTNAVKFTPANGNVILQVNADLNQDLIKFSVIDNGIGITPENLQRLFQPFVQVDSGLNRQHEGTGLGLALVQKLTDLHGGSVEVESEAGKGSCFTVKLPCLQEEVTKLEKLESQSALPMVEQTQPSGLPTPTRKHLGLVLLADDNMPSILTIGEYLESLGYEVVAAHDGLEAIQKAEAFKPDIILMDIQMPSMNGLEAIARLRGSPHFTTTPMIALTALTMPGDRERSLLAGANEYMGKPVSLKMLAKTMETLLKFGKGPTQ